MDRASQPDLFGTTAPQGALFEPAPVVSKPIQHTPETIRALMHAHLDKARTAIDRTPWSLRETRSHMVMFPYMAEWLPDEEGSQLLLEFRAEMRRLGHDEPPPLPID